MELDYTGPGYFEGVFRGVNLRLPEYYDRDKVTATVGISPTSFSLCSQPDYFYWLLGFGSTENFHQFVWENIESWRQAIRSQDEATLDEAVRNVYGEVSKLSRRGTTEIDVPQVPYEPNKELLLEHPARYNLITDTVYVNPISIAMMLEKVKPLHSLVDYLTPLLVHADTGKCDIYADMRKQLNPLEGIKRDTEEFDKVRWNVVTSVNSLLGVRERLGIDILEEMLVHHFRVAHETYYTRNRDMHVRESNKKFLEWAIRRQINPPAIQPNHAMRLYADIGKLLQQEENLGAGLRKAKAAINEAYSQGDRQDMTVFSFIQQTKSN